MLSFKILATKKVAGRNIPFEMDSVLATKISEKYNCTLRELIGKGVTLDETEIWESLRVNILEKDINILHDNPLYWALIFSEESFSINYKNLNAWSQTNRKRLSKYIKTKEVKVSYVIDNILVSEERTRTVTEFCGWRSLTLKQL